MKIFVVGGAGAVGSSAAGALARQPFVDEVVIYDVNENLAQSQAMDLSQASVFDSQAQIIAGSWEDAAGADVVVVGAGLPASQTTHDSIKDICLMKPIITSIADGLNQYCPEAVVISLSNPLDAFNYVLCRTSGLPAEQFLGLSFNDSLRFRCAVGAHYEVSPADIEAMTVGEHGPSKLPLFSTVKIHGRPLETDAAEQRAILDEMDGWWQKYLQVSGPRSATWTTGAACAQLVGYIAGVSKGPVCCSTILGEGVSIGYPVLLDGSGVTGYPELAMTPEEERAFEALVEKNREFHAAVMQAWEETK